MILVMMRRVEGEGRGVGDGDADGQVRGDAMLQREDRGVLGLSGIIWSRWTQAGSVLPKGHSITYYFRPIIRGVKNLQL